MKATLTVFLVLVLHGRIALGCRCDFAPVTIEDSARSDLYPNIMKVYPLGPVATNGTDVKEEQRMFVAKVWRVFQGEVPSQEYVVLQVPGPLKSCGDLKVLKTPWLVFVNRLPGLPDVYQLGLCTYNRRWSELENYDLAFLHSLPKV